MEILVSVLLFGIGVLLGYIYSKENRLALAILGLFCAGVLPLYAFFFPVSSIDHMAQLNWWWVLLLPVLAAGATMVVLCLRAPKSTRFRKWALTVSTALVVIIFLAPVYRPHTGWSPHAHFVWENPFHVH